MKVDDHQLIVALSEAGTIKEASKALLISQPAVSQRLKSIEAYWGKPLFIRTPKKLIPTPNGEKVISFSRNMMNETDQVMNALSMESGTVEGTLSLGVSSTIGQYYLPAVLGDFITNYPKVNIELFTGLSSEVIGQHEGFHVFITRGNKPKTHSFLLLEERLYLLRKVEAQSNVLIEFQTDSSFQTIVNQWFIQHPEQHVSTKVKVDQMETSKQLLKHGIGATVLPELAVGDLDLSDYHVTLLSNEDEQIIRKTWVSYSEYAGSFPQVQAFLAFIRSYNK
ncbi:LysR family transcriptional regulator [Alkalihalobacillus sp. FSL W8-0930]